MHGPNLKFLQLSIAPVRGACVGYNAIGVLDAAAGAGKNWRHSILCYAWPVMSEKRSYWVSRVSLALGFTAGWAGDQLIVYFGWWAFDGPGWICSPRWMSELVELGLVLISLGVFLSILGIVFSPRRTLGAAVVTGLASLALAILMGWNLLPLLGRKALSECCAGEVKEAYQTLSCVELRKYD